MGACASAPKTRGDGAWDENDVHGTSGHDSSHSGRGGARWFAAEPTDAVTALTGRGERFARSRRDVDDAERLRERVATKTSARKARPFKYASTGGDHVLRSLDVERRRPPTVARTRHARTASDGASGDSCGDESWTSSNHDSASSTVANAPAPCAETVDAPALNHVEPRNAHRRSRLSVTSVSSEVSSEHSGDDAHRRTHSCRITASSPGGRIGERRVIRRHGRYRRPHRPGGRARRLGLAGVDRAPRGRRHPRATMAQAEGHANVTGGSTRLGRGRTARCTGARTSRTGASWR